jgi:hypothetical protein
MYGKMRRSISLVALTILISFSAQAQSPDASHVQRPAATSLREDNETELADLKSDVSSMQSLLRQMQANFALVGNVTSPVNHELELNIDMWRVLISHMQRRISRMEQERSRRNGLSK